MNKSITQILLLICIAALGGFIAYKMIYIPKQIEMVGIVAILLLYPIFKIPLVGIYSAFLLAPFIPYIRRLYYILYGRPGVDPLIMVTDILVVVVFIGMFFEIKDRMSDTENSGKSYAPLIAFYIVYLVFRTFVLNIVPASEALARMKFYVPNVLLFFIGFSFAKKFIHIKIIWVLTLLIGIASSLYGLKQLYLGYSTAEKIWFSTISFTTLFIQGIARPFSIFQAPAAFADYLIVGIIAVLMCMDWGTIKTKILLLPVIFLMFYGVLITSVRSNWIGALSVFFFWFVFVNVQKAKNRLIVLGLVIIIFFTYQLLDEVLNTNANIQSMGSILGGNSTKSNYVDLLVTSRASAVTNPFEEHSLLSRITLWRFLLTSSLDPQTGLLGRGLGSLNADSLYFTYLAEFGYPGLFFIVFIILAFIGHGFGVLTLNLDKKTKTLVKGVLVFDMVFALMSLTGSHIHGFPGDMYFWFFNGMLMNIYKIDAQVTSDRVTL